MGRALVATAFLAACFTPTPPSGAPCDPVAPICPSGQTCVESGEGFSCLRPDEVPGPLDAGLDTAPADSAPPDVSSDAPPDDDPDGDDILDPDDNCPEVANALQENEDGDAYGDACDPCPPYADANDPEDPDDDGVSGRCDPNPTMAGDRIAYFTGFAQTTLPAGLTTTGSWSFAGGLAIGQAPEAQFAMITLPTPVTNETVMTQASIKTIDIGGSPTTLFSVGVATQRSGTDNGLACLLASSLVSPRRQGIFNTGNGQTLTAESYAFDEDTFYHLAFRRTGTAYRCTASLATGLNANDVEFTSTLTTSDPRSGLRIRSGTAEFKWLLVLAR